MVVFMLNDACSHVGERVGMFNEIFVIIFDHDGFFALNIFADIGD